MRKIVKIVLIFLAILGLLNLAEIRTNAVNVEINNSQGNVIEVQKSEITTNKTEKEEIKLSKTKKTLYVGEKYTLKIKGTTKKAKWWKSSNTKVATVNSNGKVTAKKKGTAEIKVKVGDKKY